MEVRLIGKTSNLKDMIYVGARTCYHPDGPLTMMRKPYPTPDKITALVRRCIASRHHSVLEHGSFVFAIEGISRACSHQLVRHRLMSFSQKSQRYVTEDEDFDYVIPPRIQRNSELCDTYESCMDMISKVYKLMVKEGIRAEDARFVLPNACTTSMVVTMNVRELIHLCEERLCTKAQWEIRTLVQAMKEAVVKEEPWLEEYLQPKCEGLGYCPEDNGCGRKGKKQ